MTLGVSKKSILTQRAQRINIENQFLASFAKTFALKKKTAFGTASMIVVVSGRRFHSPKSRIFKVLPFQLQAILQ
jgi:hypothetical protein